MTDVPGVDVVTELLRVESVVGEDTVRETINPTVELPVPAIKVFDIRAEVQDVTLNQEDTVLVGGPSTSRSSLSTRPMWSAISRKM